MDSQTNELEMRGASEEKASSRSSPIFNGITFKGYGRDEFGSCLLAISAESEDAAVGAFEARIGDRISSHPQFTDGLIVTFRNGAETAIWAKEIDCKDPPYNPLPPLDKTGEWSKDMLPTASDLNKHHPVDAEDQSIDP